MQISELLQRPVREIMVTEVVSLRPDDTLAEAAYKFLHQQISGAPVVQEDGTCVGVLSVTDVMTAAEKVALEQAQITDAFYNKSDLVLPANVYAQELAEVRDKLLPVADQPVSNFMVTDVVSVEESEPLQTVVRDFVDAHVHRVIVTDNKGKLRGIVSTIDVMASLLRVPV